MHKARRAAIGAALAAGGALALGGCGGQSGTTADVSARPAAAVATEAPQTKVTIAAPQDGATVTGSNAEVRGTVTPADASVKVLGQPAKVSDGTFSATVVLGSGENTIDVVASAGDAEPSSQTVTVVRGKSPAQLAAERARKRREARVRARREARARARRAARRRAAMQVTVPDEIGERLDVAEEDLQSAGLRFTEIGGGTFGVVVPSNWTVCETRPSAGAQVKRGTRVKLIIDRAC